MFVVVHDLGPPRDRDPRRRQGRLAKVRYSSAPSVKGLGAQPDSINLCLDKTGPKPEPDRAATSTEWCGSVPAWTKMCAEIFRHGNPRLSKCISSTKAPTWICSLFNTFPRHANSKQMAKPEFETVRKKVFRLDQSAFSALAILSSHKSTQK